eukprot:3595762-Pyramimonas_sp.AAC.1
MTALGLQMITAAVVVCFAIPRIKPFKRSEPSDQAPAGDPMATRSSGCNGDPPIGPEADDQTAHADCAVHVATAVCGLLAFVLTAAEQCAPNLP